MLLFALLAARRRQRETEMNWRDVRWVPLGVTAILSGLFTFAGIVKLGDTDTFLVDFYNYKILPYEWIELFVYIVPVVEIVLALGLWVPRFRRASAMGYVFLLLVFSGAIISAGVRDLDISCGCFGKNTPHLSYTGLVIRNFILMGMAGYLCWLWGKPNLQPASKIK